MAGVENSMTDTGLKDFCVYSQMRLVYSRCSQGMVKVILKGFVGFRINLSLVGKMLYLFYLSISSLLSGFCFSALFSAFLSFISIYRCFISVSFSFFSLLLSSLLLAFCVFSLLAFSFLFFFSSFPSVPSSLFFFFHVFLPFLFLWFLHSLPPSFVPPLFFRPFFLLHVIINLNRSFFQLISFLLSFDDPFPSISFFPSLLLTSLSHLFPFLPFLSRPLPVCFLFSFPPFHNPSLSVPSFLLFLSLSFFLI